MNPACLRHTELSGSSALFLDFLYHWDRVARYYEHNPFEPESYRRAALRVDYPGERRARIGAVLERQNGPSEALEKFRNPDTVAVVTGQQVGLFSGPCYTIYKALTAARVTERLNAEGIPAVTVFWLATEDHDFAEVNHAWSFDAAMRPVRHEIADSAGTGRPVGGIAPGSYPVEELRRVLGEFPFGAEVSDLASRFYQPGLTVGAAFGGLLRKLLADYHLLYFDPMDPEVRPVAAPILSVGVREAAELNAKLLERNRELAENGYHAQVHVEVKTSPAFVLENGRRVALRRDGNVYLASGRRYTAEELAGRGEQLSPNALLRPVMQDYLFPTAALVAGPAEIAYLAQTQVLYRGLGRPMPVVLPRSGFTLVDGRASKLLDRYGLSMREVLEGGEAVRSRIAGQLVPARLREAMETARGSATRILDELGREAAGFDGTLAAALSKSRAKMLYQLSKIETKAAREALRRDERARSEAGYLSGLLFPGNHLQERLYTILPFLARHGFDLIGRLYQQVRLDCPDHIVAPL